jgi:hypothetical protein
VTDETIARPKKRKPTPPDALSAFDVVTKAGFATLEQGLHVIDHQLKHDPFAEHRTVREWIEAIRKHAGTDWFSIEKRSLPWRGGWCAGYVDRPSIGRPQAGWHVIFWDPYGEDREHAAWLGAYYLLRAEKRCRARDIDRAHRLLRQGSQSPDTRPISSLESDERFRLVRDAGRDAEPGSRREGRRLRGGRGCGAPPARYVVNTSIKPTRLREVPGFAEAVAWLSEAYAHEPSRWERTGDVLMPVALEKVDYVIVQSLADVIAHAQAMTDHHRRAMRAGLRVFKGGAAAVAGGNAPCTPWWRADEPVHLQVLWERPVENDNDPEINWTHWRRLTWVQAAWVQRSKERRDAKRR